FSVRCYRSALHSFPTRRSSDLRAWREDASCARWYASPIPTPCATGRVRFSQSWLGRLGMNTILPPALREASCSRPATLPAMVGRSEEHTSELQSRENLVCRLLL